MKRYVPLFLCLTLFCLAVQNSGILADGMRQSLALCTKTLVPSLFPLFVLARMLSDFGLGDAANKRFGRLLQRLFRLSPAGVGIFVLGLCGGYPLGAVMTAEVRKKGCLGRAEAERVLAFCNNSGPAFIVGAGGAVLCSVKAGLFLYLAHVLAAVCTGLYFRRDASGPAAETDEPIPPKSPAAILTDAVSGALMSCLNLSAYVCFFGSLSALGGGFAFLTGLRRALALGFAELGSGIGTLSGYTANPVTMALAGFMFGWGGLSVHCQTLGAVAGTDIKCARHLLGRALCGAFGAVFSAVFSFFC